MFNLSSIVVPVVVVLVVEVTLKVCLLPESHPSPVHGMRWEPAAEEHVEYLLGRHVCNEFRDAFFVRNDQIRLSLRNVRNETSCS